MQTKFNALALSVVLSAAMCKAVQARGNDVVITDGQGEQVTIKHGFFGRNTKIVKDRFGDGIGTKSGLLGTRDKEVNILGNGFTSHTGILGATTVRGSDILGDKIQTKRGIFGRKTTYVDASGTANALRTLWNENKPKAVDNSKIDPLNPGGFNAPALPWTPSPAAN